MPVEEVCSSQAAILHQLFHRFLRGRDSMKAKRGIAVNVSARLRQFATTVWPYKDRGVWFP